MPTLNTFSAAAVEAAAVDLGRRVLEAPHYIPAVPKLAVDRVYKSFPLRLGSLAVLEDINLTIGEGEFVCLVGPSGCGKTTLFNIIAGLEPSDRGLVAVDDRLVHGPGPDRVVVFQEGALFQWLTVQGNVEFGLEMAGVPVKERRQRAFAALEAVQLGRFRHALIHELSGGMRQRVAIARALAMNPEILLMDEPFASLDPQTRDDLHVELEALWTNKGRTVMFITHNVWEAVRLGDRVLVMSGRPGRILREFIIDRPRPRRPDDPALLVVESQILACLRDGNERARAGERGGARPCLP